MRKTIFAALALIALASCTKETSVPTLEDTSSPVAALFAEAAITRATDNKWEAGDKIGITMTTTTTTTLADGSYSNVSYTVGAAGESATFAPTAVEAPAVADTIYFPTDGSKVDFYAYCPLSTIDSDNNIAVSVATQSFADIDLIAAKAVGYDKNSATVSFTGDNAFKHQLSKLTITLKMGDGISSLAGLKTTIKGQSTTAKYNLYTGAISSLGDVADITALTVTDGTSAEAILIPSAAVDASSIVFSLGSDDYIWDTSAIAFEQGSEHNYEITVTKTKIILSGATISTWGDGTDGSATAE